LCAVSYLFIVKRIIILVTTNVIIWANIILDQQSAPFQENTHETIPKSKHFRGSMKNIIKNCFYKVEIFKATTD
jgi:hypothetical protein